MEMTNRSCWDDTGKLLLRIAIGGLMLFHGIAKIMSIDPIIKIVKDNGLPEYFAYGVYVGEMLAPALILIGWWTRLASIVFAFNMAASVLLARRGDVFVIDKDTGGWAIEINVLYFLGALAIFFLGAGHYSVDGCPWRGSASTAPPASQGAKQP